MSGTGSVTRPINTNSRNVGNNTKGPSGVTTGLAGGGTFSNDAADSGVHASMNGLKFNHQNQLANAAAGVLENSQPVTSQQTTLLKNRKEQQVASSFSSAANPKLNKAPSGKDMP